MVRVMTRRGACLGASDDEGPPHGPHMWEVHIPYWKVSIAQSLARSGEREPVRPASRALSRLLRFLYDPPVSDFKGHRLRMYAGLPRPRRWHHRTRDLEVRGEQASFFFKTCTSARGQSKARPRCASV